MNEPRCIAVVTTDGTVLRTSTWKRGMATLERWNPGTWLGRGDTAGEATVDAIKLAMAYREKHGDWKPPVALNPNQISK